MDCTESLDYLSVSGWQELVKICLGYSFSAYAFVVIKVFLFHCTVILRSAWEEDGHIFFTFEEGGPFYSCDHWCVFSQTLQQLNQLNSCHQEAVMKCLKSRKNEIKQALLGEIVDISCAQLKDFDWQLKVRI